MVPLVIMTITYLSLICTHCACSTGAFKPFLFPVFQRFVTALINVGPGR
jgi:hypothetical protein